MQIKAFIVIVWCPLAKLRILRWPQSTCIAFIDNRSRARACRAYAGDDPKWRLCDDPKPQCRGIIRYARVFNENSSDECIVNLNTSRDKKFSSFFFCVRCPILGFNLASLFFAASLSSLSMASSISSFRMMMKFLGNWVKCAYTQKHCFALAIVLCLMQRRLRFYQMQLFCTTLYSLNLHDMSGALVRYFQLNYSTAEKKIAWNFSFFLRWKFQMSCLIKRIKYMERLFIWRSDSVIRDVLLSQQARCAFVWLSFMQSKAEWKKIPLEVLRRPFALRLCVDGEANVALLIRKWDGLVARAYFSELNSLISWAHWSQTSGEFLWRLSR